MTRADDNDRRTELDAFLNGEREVKLCLHCEREITYDPERLAWVDADGRCDPNMPFGYRLARCSEVRSQRHEPGLDAAERIHDHGIADPRPTLESCICGEHRDCPDGWHSDADMPCGCTADCALEDDEAEHADARALVAEMDGVRPR